MKTIIFSGLFLLFAIHDVRSISKQSMDYFVMNEAHIQEHRNNENAKIGYPPFYVECNEPLSRKSCSPAAPKLNALDGLANIKQRFQKSVYYGCPQRISLTNVLDPEGHYKTSLIMQKAKVTINPGRGMPNSYNIYDHKCTSDVSPVLWRNGLDRGPKLLYGIGFLIPALAKMPIAEVFFDHEKKIPIWTKHTLHGISLASPIAPYRSIEEIEYQEDSDNYNAAGLKTILSSYYKFNELNSPTRQEVNEELVERGLQKIPERSYIVMGHLVPEYDMVENSWKKVPRFAQTIVPTWKDIYSNEWADVDNYIREVAFLNDKKLTVYSGTHGQLTFNAPVGINGERPKLYLGNEGVVVPEFIWKLVIDESPTLGVKKAIVIIIHNISEKLKGTKIFAESRPPCASKCQVYLWISFDSRNKQIYCCDVSDIKSQVRKEDFPPEIVDTNFLPFVLS